MFLGFFSLHSRSCLGPFLLSRGEVFFWRWCRYCIALRLIVIPDRCSPVRLLSCANEIHMPQCVASAPCPQICGDHLDWHDTVRRRKAGVEHIYWLMSDLENFWIGKMMITSFFFFCRMSRRREQNTPHSKCLSEIMDPKILDLTIRRRQWNRQPSCAFQSLKFIFCEPALSGALGKLVQITREMSNISGAASEIHWTSNLFEANISTTSCYLWL